MVVGVVYFVKKKVIVQKFFVIEFFVGVEIFCFDKIGIFIKNKFFFVEFYIVVGVEFEDFMLIVCLVVFCKKKGMDVIDKVFFKFFKFYFCVKFVFFKYKVFDFYFFDFVFKKV